MSGEIHIDEDTLRDAKDRMFRGLGKAENKPDSQPPDLSKPIGGDSKKAQTPGYVERFTPETRAAEIEAEYRAMSSSRRTEIYNALSAKAHDFEGLLEKGFNRGTGQAEDNQMLDDIRQRREILERIGFED